MRRHLDPDGSVAVREDFQRLMESAARAEVRQRDARKGRLHLDLARASRSLPFSDARLVSGGLQKARDYSLSGSRLREDVRGVSQARLRAIPAIAASGDRTALGPSRRDQGLLLSRRPDGLGAGRIE